MRKTIILITLVSLLLVSLISAQEYDWDKKGIQTFTLLERILHSFISGATIPDQCSSTSHIQKVFDANTLSNPSSVSVGSACNDGDYVALFNCGLSSSYSSSSACNYGGSIREGYKLITSVTLNANNRYMYFCYDCGATTTPPTTEKTFRGFCLDSHNICVYIDRTYTEQQQILSTYQSYDCIKPTFPNLYSTSSECESNRQSQITCYTDCINGKYEVKSVTATFCSDLSLKSIPPSNCIAPTAKPCIYNGVTYQPGDLFCYGDNIVKCVNDLTLNTIENCKDGCKDGKCISISENKCCRALGILGTDSSGKLEVGYIYKKEEMCISPFVEVSLDKCSIPSEKISNVTEEQKEEAEQNQEIINKEGEDDLSCIKTSEPFYTNGKLFTNAGLIFGILGGTSSGAVTRKDLEKLDELVPSFSTRYRMEASDSVCCDGVAAYKEGKTISDTLLIGIGTIWTSYKHLNYEVYTCEPKGEGKTDFCFNWVTSIGTSLGAKNNVCTVGWFALVVIFVVVMIIISRIGK